MSRFATDAEREGFVGAVGQCKVCIDTHKSGQATRLRYGLRARWVRCVDRIIACVAPQVGIATTEYQRIFTNKRTGLRS